MRTISKVIALAGLIAPLAFSTQAHAQEVATAAAATEAFEIVAVSLDIDRKLAARQAELSADLTSLINAKMSARIEKIQNEPATETKPILVLAQR
ncbi:MAG: hypothetical protein AAGJ73_04900 [Pseudomonadota bacterium]